MKNLSRSFLLSICLTVLCVFVQGQVKESQNYYLRHNLFFLATKFRFEKDTSRLSFTSATRSKPYYRMAFAF
ncbi:MAG TPA: hypothetical protein VK892_15930 [Pyrinomonadaceae bacterium]|nr:hypothetical protein [Pyrinomonadaceae bacterium]